MASTTNYSWTTPDDTALVKDGAAAIRSLGTAIDTTVFNNAGAAIAKTIVDAKGDIIAATASDTVSRLAVGANDTVLTADSTTATGLKWAAPASGSTFVGARATGNSNQSIPNNTFTAITWNTDLIDTDAIHDTSTNSERFTVPSGKAGKWFITSRCTFAGDNGGERRLAIYKNAATTLTDFRTSAEGTTGQSLTVNSIYDLVVGDYLQIMAYQDTGGALNIDREISDCSFYYLGA